MTVGPSDLFVFPIPDPTSNEIGTFEIGVSQIGTINPFRWEKTVLSQYANSPILVTLLESIVAWLDQTQNFDSFYDLIWNVNTAQGYGLDVWGRIVGVNRVLQVSYSTWFGFEEALPGSDDFNSATLTYGPSFGFEEATNAYPFNQATFGLHPQFPSGVNSGSPFYSGAPLTSNFALSDQAYRQLILAKAAANITSGSIPAINAILRSLFPNRGNCYVTEGYTGASYFGFEEAGNAFGFGQQSFYTGTTINTMQMTYTFNFSLTPVELAIVENSGVLPKPVGVAATVVIL